MSRLSANCQNFHLNVDKMSTAAGLEVRMPLTDRRIFDIACDRRGVTKRLLHIIHHVWNNSKIFFRIELVSGLYEEMEGLDPLSKMSNVDIQIWLEGDIYLNVYIFHPPSRYESVR